jgi:hypothetical protein
LVFEELATHHDAMQEDDGHASSSIVEAEGNSIAERLNRHAHSSIHEILRKKYYDAN